MKQNKCETCRYSCMVNVGLDGEMLRACLYILHEGQRRPCAFGTRCTVYSPRDRERAAEREAV